MLLQDNLEEFGTKVLEGVAARQGIDKFPVKAEIFENIIVDTLDEMEISCYWDPGSHKPGADIEITNEPISFSVKSAGISGGKQKPQKMSISSHRLTSHKTLKEKLAFIDGTGKNYTHYLVLAREDIEGKSNKKNKKILIKRNYTLLAMPADIFSVNKLTWQQVGKSYKTKESWDGKMGYSMKIEHSMSDQLWIHSGFDKVKKRKDVKVLGSFSIDAEDLGNTHKIVRRAA